MNRVKKEILELTKKLIMFKTLNERNHELERCIDFIADYLISYDINVEKFSFKDKPCLVATFNKSKKQKIFLNGHIDVVGAAEVQFQPQVKGGKIFGRGANDMKAAIATFLVLMKNLSKKKKKPAVGLMIVSDEETGGVNGTKRLLAKGYCANLALIGEPTLMQVKTKHKGSMQIKVKAYGKAGHSARPWQGDNAIEKLMKNYLGIQSLMPPEPKRSHWKPTMVITNIISEGSTNVIPTKAEMILSVRTVENFNNNSFIKIMDELNLNYEVLFRKEMMKTRTRHKYVNSLRETAEIELNKKIRKIKGSGSTDGCYFSQRNIPTIIFGPRGKGHHTFKEYVHVESLLPYYNILYKFINKNFN